MKGSAGVNRADKRGSVNDDLLSAFARLLRLSTNAQSVFWVAALSGAATRDGWSPTHEEREYRFESLRGKKIGPKPFHDALAELTEANLVDASLIDGARIHCKVAEPFVRLLSYDSSLQSNINYKNKAKTKVQEENQTNIADHVTTRLRSLDRVVGGRKDEDRDQRERKKEKRKKEKFACDLFREQVLPGIGESERAKIPGIRYREITRSLVEHWAKRSGRKKVRVLDRRVAMVKARIRDGYEVNDLYQAIAGVCYSPFHRENGHDTFEVAIRNGEQVEKGKRLWLLHAPIEYVRQYVERTGERVPAREAELASSDRTTAIDEDYRKRIELAKARQEEAEACKKKEEQRDMEMTEIAMSCLENGG
jgi:hypothetical protein